MNFRFAIGLVLMSLLLASCAQDSPSLIVELRTDYVPGEEFDGISINGERVRGARLTDDFMTGERVTQIETTQTYQLFDLEITLRGSVVGSRETVVRGTGKRGVTVVITRNCAEVMCPDASNSAATACLDGACVSTECTPQNPTGCPPVPQCANDDDCSARSAACGIGACIEGTCLVAADHDMCGSDEFCEPGIGCATRTSLVSDAGTDDAGFDDVGVDAGVDVGADSGVDASDCVADEDPLCNGVDEDCDGSVDEGCTFARVSDARPMQIAGETITVEYSAPGREAIELVMTCGDDSAFFPLPDAVGTAKVTLNATTDPFGRDCRLELASGGEVIERVHEMAVGRLIAFENNGAASQIVALDVGRGETVSRASIEGGDALGAGVFGRQIVYSAVHSSGTVWSSYDVETNTGELLGAVVYGGAPGPSVVAVAAPGIYAIRPTGGGSVLLRREHDAASVTSGPITPHLIPIPPASAQGDAVVWIVANAPEPMLVGYDLETLENRLEIPLPVAPTAIALGDEHVYWVDSDSMIHRVSLESGDPEPVGMVDSALYSQDLLYDADNGRLIFFGAEAGRYFVTTYGLIDGVVERFEMGTPRGEFDWSHPRLIF